MTCRLQMAIASLKALCGTQPLKSLSAESTHVERHGTTSKSNETFVLHGSNFREVCNEIGQTLGFWLNFDIIRSLSESDTGAHSVQHGP